MSKYRYIIRTLPLLVLFLFGFQFPPLTFSQEVTQAQLGQWIEGLSSRDPASAKGTAIATDALLKERLKQGGLSRQQLKQLFKIHQKGAKIYFAGTKACVTILGGYHGETISEVGGGKPFWQPIKEDSKWDGSKNELTGLNSFPAIKLDLRSVLLSAKDAKLLGSLKTVVDLDLGLWSQDKKDTAAVIKAIGGMDKLTALTIDGKHFEFESETLAAIGKLTELQELTLSGQYLFSDQVNFLRELKHIRKLEFAGCQFDDEIAKLISNKTELMEIDLTDCPIADKTIESLGALQKLEKIVLKGTRVRDQDLKLIRFGKSKSAVLDLFKTQISDEGVAAIPRSEIDKLLVLNLPDGVSRSLMAEIYLRRKGQISIGWQTTAGGRLLKMTKTEIFKPTQKELEEAKQRTN